MRRICWTITLLVLVAGCGTDEVTEPTTGALIEAKHLLNVDLTPGIRTVQVGPTSNPMRLTLAVPDSLPAATPPLVLALHWSGANAPHRAEQYLQLLAEPGLRRLKAIIIAPEATGRNWSSTEVARSLSSLVRAALEAWLVDPARVVVTGFSMGGVGTWYLISLYPELFSAAIPVAGEPTAVLAPGVPLLAIHGELDAMFSLAVTQQAVDSLQSLGGNASLLVAPGLEHNAVNDYGPYLDQAVTWLTESAWATR